MTTSRKSADCAAFTACANLRFGSVLRSDFDPQRSDVDVLVEFEPQVASSFANFLDLKEALEGLLRRPVDLVELHTIRNRRLRHYIEQSKSPVYAAA